MFTSESVGNSIKNKATLPEINFDEYLEEIRVGFRGKKLQDALLATDDEIWIDGVLCSRKNLLRRIT